MNFHSLTGNDARIELIKIEKLPFLADPMACLYSECTRFKFRPILGSLLNDMYIDGYQVVQENDKIMP
jgi:hypothetical protein